MQKTINIVDQQIFQTGGLAGIIGSIVFIALFPIVAFFVGEDPATLVGWVERFESIRYARVVENGGYMLALILWMAYFMALHRAAHPGHAGFALFGSGLCVVGLGVLLAGALTHVAVTPLHEIYYAESTTASEQSALVLMWQATWGMLDALLIAGFAPIAIGISMLGLAMARSPYFGKWLGGFTLIIGIFSIVAVVVLLVYPSSIMAVVNVFGLILLNLITGGRLMRLVESA